MNTPLEIKKTLDFASLSRSAQDIIVDFLCGQGLPDDVQEDVKDEIYAFHESLKQRLPN